jgi:hypothetical protein
MRAPGLDQTRRTTKQPGFGQAAQAAKDPQLLECVSLCHPETLRTLRWSLTKLKAAAPQILTR